MIKRLIYVGVLSLLLAQPSLAAAADKEVLLPLPSFADLVEKLQPGVVNISTTHLPEEMESADDALGIVSPNPQIQDYFAPHNPQQLSLGSGFIVDEDGYIVTNYHVINKAQEIMVTLADERQFNAEIIGTDVKTDLALIKIQTQEKLPTVVLGDSDDIRVGDWVIAIGNPFGLGGSVSVGIVSAKSRDIDAGAYDNFIQTDASINQGSSGGPMFNAQGEVIGINSAIYSTTGGSMGIGFAVPINLAKFVIAELKAKGKVERGWLGIKIQATPAVLPEEISTPDQSEGIVITSVSENSPAAKAGIEAGDIILSLNGKKADTPKDFSRNVAETEPNTQIRLQVWRENKILPFELKTEKMPEDAPQPQPVPEPEADKGFDLSFETVSPELIEQYQLPHESRGVVVISVTPGSDAEIKGIKPGDLITEIDKKPVLDINDAMNYLNEARRENNRPVLFLINNNNIPNYAAVKL